MAEAAVKHRLSIFCSMCLDVLNQPVTIPCGHSYCLNCFKDCWCQDDQGDVYKCPQCKESFENKPPPRTNTPLEELVDKMKTAQLHTSPAADSYAGSGDVECDICTERKLKAVKSCLMCLASYCEAHLKLHNYLHPGNTHKMVDATRQLKKRICSRHDKLLEVFCCTDQQCICYLCTMDEHKGHETISAAAEKAEMERQLLTDARQRIPRKEQEIRVLQQAMEGLKSSAKKAMEDSDRTLVVLLHSIKRWRSEVREMIRAQEEVEVRRAEELLRKHEQELAELRRGDAELEQLSLSEDHIHLLQKFQSVPPKSKAPPSATVFQVSLKDLQTCVCELQQELQIVVAEKMAKMRQIDSVKADCNPKPSQLFQHTSGLTLDPNTANQHFVLSGENRVVTRTNTAQPYPEHPERFSQLRQVLCTQPLSGAVFWELEWKGDRVDVAVAYKEIARKGCRNLCLFGRNKNSWSLVCTPSKCTFYHNKIKTVISVSCFNRMSVYLDQQEGSLSFFSSSDTTMLLIHSVQTTFTKPLYLGLGVYGSQAFVKIL